MDYLVLYIHFIYIYIHILKNISTNFTIFYENKINKKNIEKSNQTPFSLI